jgi:hypothetical protein
VDAVVDECAVVHRKERVMSRPPRRISASVVVGQRLPYRRRCLRIPRRTCFRFAVSHSVEVPSVHAPLRETIPAGASACVARHMENLCDALLRPDGRVVISQPFVSAFF